MTRILILVDGEFRRMLKDIAKGKKITVKTLTKRLANEKERIKNAIE